MNQIAIIGRLTKDPDVRYTTGANQMAIANFTLAVNREYKKDGEQTADFISCKAFKKTAELIEKYVKKGSLVGIQGRIQTGSYEKDGRKIYTTDVVVDRLEFLDSKSGSSAPSSGSKAEVPSDIPEGFSLTEEMIPF